MFRFRHKFGNFGLTSDAFASPGMTRSRGIAWTVVMFAILGFVRPVVAEDWMFAPSYFSHSRASGLVPVPDPPHSRGAYRTPFYDNRPGMAIRGGYRFNSIVINSGLSVDRTMIRENWFDVRP